MTVKIKTSLIRDERGLWKCFVIILAFELGKQTFVKRFFEISFGIACPTSNCTGRPKINFLAFVLHGFGFGIDVSLGINRTDSLVE